MKMSGAPIIILAGGSLVVAMVTCAQYGETNTGSDANANDSTTNAPSSMHGGGGGAHGGYLATRGYRPSTLIDGDYVAPDGRILTETEALGETGYVSPVGEETTTRGGFGESGEGHAGGEGSGHAGGGE